MLRPPEDRLVRPTLRCLIEDLGGEVGPPDLRSALQTAVADMGDDATYLFPCHLAAVEHIVIDKANLLAGDAAAHRERIEAITDRTVVKVKTSNRRGALWRDDEGTWWLVAAGRRKDDGPGDFYRDLARHAGDSTPIAPTDIDQRYLRFEEAYVAEVEAEREAQRHVLSSLFAACRRLTEPQTVRVFGADVSVVVIPDDDGLAVLEMSWEMRYFEQQDRFPSDILAMVPHMEDIDHWEYLPPRTDSDSPHSWFAYIDLRWVEWLGTAAELDDLLSVDWLPPNPSTDGSENFSHYASKRVVTIAYVEGIEIQGLCGARIVPHRDPERLPTCPVCTETVGFLRQGPGRSA